MLDHILSFVPGAAQEIIQIANSPMTVMVYNLKYQEFTPPAGAIVWYGTGSDPLAFLVKGPDEQQLDILQIILRWYAVKFDFPEMEFTLEDPRPPVALRIVR